jgi:hypothetical protein
MISDLKTAVSTDDTAHIKQLTEQLQQASYALSQQLYQQQQHNGQPNGSGATDEEVVEGEFQEM